MTNSEQLEIVKDKLKQYICDIDNQNTSLRIILHDDQAWLDGVRASVSADENLIIISDIDEFRSFIISNGCSKLYIDINFSKVNGIDLAEEMALNKGFADLFFISDEVPSVKDVKRIHRLGATYLEKYKALNLLKRRYKNG